MTRAAALLAALLVLAGIPAVVLGGEPTYIFPVQPAKAAGFSKGGHGYLAIDIFSKKGTEFVAPVSGVIEDVQKVDEWDPKVNDPEKKGGKSVSLIGDDGFRYYGSHLNDVAAEVSVGKKVKAGELLGHVGNSGNAKGTPSHVHFGISRASRPYTWKTRRGEIEPFGFLQCIQKKECDPARVLEKASERQSSTREKSEVRGR